MAIDSTRFTTLLERYPAFGEAPHDFPNFVYAAPDDRNLSALRHEYGLESIAGQGDETARALRVMDWAHHETDVRGEYTEPEQLDAASLLAFARARRGPLFCDHRAEVLVEALLSLGISARRLTCLPHDFDFDCHVVAMAYLPAVRQWVCLDPTLNTYFHDEAGLPLSMLEVREAYRVARPPRFRSIHVPATDAIVFAGQECESYDEFYAAYMAKNCFRFHSPLRSAFGYSAADDGPTVLLNPVGYTVANEYDRRYDDRGLFYCRSDSRYFMEAPAV